MKKYTSLATKWLAFLAIISAVMLAIGIVSIVTNFSNIGFQVGFTMIGSIMCILFAACFFAEKSRWIKIDDDKIVLPRGAIINGKIVFKRTVIKIADIRSVESTLHKGDGLISKDTRFHTLKLKDKTKITFTLYAYGNEAEKEIVDTIKASLINSDM